MLLLTDTGFLFCNIIMLQVLYYFPFYLPAVVINNLPSQSQQRSVNRDNTTPVAALPVTLHIGIEEDGPAVNALATLESPIDILDLVGEYEEIPSPQFPIVEVLEESNAMTDPGHIADVNTTDESLPLEEEDEDKDDDRNRDPDYEVTPADTASEDEELVATEREEPHENEGQEQVASEGVEPPRKKKKAPLPREPPIWQVCGTSCKKACSEMIPDDHRTGIWTGYQELNYNEKRQMIFQHVSRATKQRLTTGEHASRRDKTFSYKLKNADGIDRQVCKKFFLQTLGYNEKNDRLVTTVMKTTTLTALTVKKDMRGHHPSEKKKDRTPIIDHIESFNPSISHYRREHAPNRRYLPSDITIKFMHADYKDNHPGIDKCEYETYRKTVSDLNISFTKLGEEECEKSTAHEEHLQTPGHHGEGGGGLVEDGNAPGECDVCREWREHKDRAKASREMYQDNSKQEWPAECCVRSVDLQKVIMLPRMPGNKTAIFTKRIVAFHETFATVGKKAKGKGKENTTSVVWHEGVAGRKAEEIASAFVSALEKDRDRKHVILWLDNCTAQNKNWCLITTLVGLVNSDAVEFEDITLKFFETGHTFMSADSFHHGVELEMKKGKGGNVYDFPEFVDVVKKSNSGKVDVIVLDNEKVRAYKGGQSQVKLKKAKVLLGKMCVFQLRRGSRNLHFKTSHADDDFQQVDFLKNAFSLDLPPKLRTEGRGIPDAKKTDIVSKLCPMMPASRRSFWENMMIGDAVDNELD